MTLPGGPAAKLGNRFEKLWTLSELVRMLNGDTHSLRIEVPGQDGAEFVVHADTQREFHQAKRSHPSGKWSIASLEGEGILSTIGEVLRDRAHRFVLVSGSGIPELKDLCEAAASAESLEEFTHQFLTAKTRASAHRRTCSIWRCEESDAWEMLRRVKVRTIDDHELETKVQWGLAPLFTDTRGAQAKLLAVIDDAVHRTIERDELILELRKAGHPLRRGPRDSRPAVAEATERYLAGARRSLINGSIIRRDSVADIVARLTGDHPSDCVLTGRAGVGKTACVVQIVERLQKAGAPVLALRLDRHMAAKSTTDLGCQLDLEESPAVILGALTKTDRRPTVLIVDQLDAVSAMSGRSSDAFDVVEHLLMEAKPASVRTLVVCRSFDWQHDPQLRGLLPDESQRTDLGDLSLDDVRSALSAADVHPGALSTEQLKLLGLPQNLSLFLNSKVGSSAASFRTTKDLFDGYWRFKREQVAQRTPRVSDQWMGVIRTVCAEMTRTQQLAVAKERLDQFSPNYLAQFVSEGVLTVEGNVYGFGHESFFDYCFARIFTADDASLTDVLKSSEQHLFRRAQVRQVLTYLRDADFQRYIREVRDLVSDPDVRVHIKDLAFALLAAVDNPMDAEWNLWMSWVRPGLDAMERDVANGDRLSQRAWERLYWAKSWFRFFDDRAVIKGWLADGNSRQRDLAALYLSYQQHFWPDEVAALLEPYANHGGNWPRFLGTVIGKTCLHASRRLFDLFLTLVDNGTFDVPDATVPSFDQLLTLIEDGASDRFDAVPSGDFSELYRSLAEKRPEWVPEVLAHQLRRAAVRSYATSVKGRSDAAAWRSHMGAGDELYPAISSAMEREPRTFVNHLLPAVLETSDGSLEGSTHPTRDAVWPCLIKSNLPRGVDACLITLACALANLARRGDDLRNQIAWLKRRPTFVANYLLLALYRGNVTRYADEAVIAFCDDPWRFDCGFLDSRYWTATKTIEATISRCTAANRVRLEDTVLSYVAPYERTKEGIRGRGWAAFNLLAAIPESLRSVQAERKFGELGRKFGRPPTPAPQGIVGGVVGSPIASEATEKMDDEQWLGAIAAWPSSRDPSLFGGRAVMLARQLGRGVEKGPERFANLGLRLPSTTDPVYFSELLRGLAGTALADSIKVEVAQWVFKCAREECGGEIADLLASASTALPERALQMLMWLATEPRDAAEEAWRQDAGDGQRYYGGGIHFNGINTSRGRAVEAIGRLINMDASYIRRFGTSLDMLAGEPHPSVASCAAMTLRIVAYHDAERGLSLFRRMDFSEERLLATPHVYEFIRENIWHGFNELEGTILRALRSALPDVRQAGARLACLAALHHTEAGHSAAEARHGDSHQRRGVAQVASANIGNNTHREWCEDVLRSLFSDQDVEVRKLAASCFRHVPGDRLDAYSDLVEAFCASQTCEEYPHPLLRTLKNARSRLPGTVYLACKSLLDRMASQARDVWQHPGAHGFAVVEQLVFRLYQHHQNDEWTPGALDLIDRVCLELGGAAEGFEDFER